MPTRSSLLLVLAMGAVLAGCAASVTYARPFAPPPRGVSVDVDLFYDELAPFGEWTWNGDAGWVWWPNGVPPGWRPYTDGHWVLTDDGWLWRSDFEWGWAPFHYGRWSYDSALGWFWVPGTVWSPAWVAWRYGEGYVGWAPLPPGVHWRAGIGLEFGGVDLDDMVPAFSWCFVQGGRMLDPRIHQRLVPEARNVTLLRVTRDDTHYAAQGDRVVDRGVEVARIEKAIGRPIERHAIREAPSPLPMRGRAIARGETVEVYRPRVARPPAGREPAPPPARRPAPPVAHRAAPRPSRQPRAEGGRAEAAPAAPPAELLRQQEIERQRLESRLSKQREAVRRMQRAETAHPPSGVTAGEMRRRHDDEQRALEEQARRERAVLAARQERERSRTARRPAPPARGHGKGRG